MQYIKVTYDAPRFTKIRKVDYYAFNDKVTEEKIEKFLKDKQDEFECEVAEFLVKMFDYTEPAAIFAASVNVDWDFIDIINVDWDFIDVKNVQL